MSTFALKEGECLAITKYKTTLKELMTAIKIEVIGGEILKITRLASFGDCFVKIYSCQKKALTLSNATYSCDYSVLKILNESYALMLISIPDPAKRLMICSSSENETFLTHLNLNDVVNVNKAVLKRDKDAVCVVKYIGAVPQIGPGTYIGLVFFDKNDNLNEKNYLARQYFNCQNGFIRNCGCFFTRKFLLDQDTDKLLEINKQSRPQSVIVTESLKNKPKPSAPRIPKATDLPPPYTAVTVQQNTPDKILYKARAPSKPEYVSADPKQNINETISHPLHSPTTALYNHNIIHPSPVSNLEANKPAIYPRQQYKFNTISRPTNEYNPGSTITQYSPSDNLAMCSTSNFIEKHRTLNRGTEKVTIRRSIREGPKSTAKRIIIEEKVIYQHSGDKKKKRCSIM